MIRSGVVVALLIVAAGCSRAPAAREYQLQGQILAIAPERREVTIKHQDIKNFMPGMTMPFVVRDGALLTDKQPGDLVTATLVVEEVSAHLSTLTRTGHAALEEAPPVADTAPVLDPGEAVADASLVNEEGAPASLAALRGHRLALTFIYTRCPIPDFCPLMDRHFAAVQKTVASTPALADVRLVTLTLDPAFDTPAILKPYARRRGADPSVWSFLTGEPEEVSRFSSQFGLYVERSPQSAVDITHNLRTAVIDADGRLVKMHTGNSWTPADLVADLTAIPAPTH